MSARESLSLEIEYRDLGNPSVKLEGLELSKHLLPEEGLVIETVPMFDGGPIRPQLVLRFVPGDVDVAFRRLPGTATSGREEVSA